MHNFIERTNMKHKLNQGETNALSSKNEGWGPIKEQRQIPHKILLSKCKTSEEKNKIVEAPNSSGEYNLNSLESS